MSNETTGLEQNKVIAISLADTDQIPDYNAYLCHLWRSGNRNWIIYVREKEAPFWTEYIKEGKHGR